MLSPVPGWDAGGRPDPNGELGKFAVIASAAGVVAGRVRPKARLAERRGVLAFVTVSGKHGGSGRFEYAFDDWDA